MIEEAISDFEIDLENSIIIGDRVEIEGIMAKKIGIKYKIFDRENSGKFI